MLWGGELVLRDGVAGRAGDLAAWGDDRRRAASVWPTSARRRRRVRRDWVGEGAYEVDVGGDRRPGARVAARRSYDPGNERVR